MRPSQHIRKTCSYEIQPTSLSAAQATHAHVWPLSSRAGGDVTGRMVSPLTHVVPLHLGTLEMRKQAGILFMEGAPGILLRERGGDLRAFPQDICPSFPNLGQEGEEWPRCPTSPQPRAARRSQEACRLGRGNGEPRFGGGGQREVPTVVSMLSPKPLLAPCAFLTIP